MAKAVTFAEDRDGSESAQRDATSSDSTDSSGSSSDGGSSGPPVQRPITLQAAEPVTIGTDATLPEHSTQSSWGEWARSWLPSSRPAVGKPENADGSEYTQRNDQESAPTASSGWRPVSQSLGGGSGAASSARPDWELEYKFRPRSTTRNTSKGAPVREESAPTASSGWLPVSQSLGGGSGAASSARPDWEFVYKIRPRSTTRNTSKGAPVREVPRATYDSMSRCPAPGRQHTGCPCSFQSTMLSVSAGVSSSRPHPHFHVVPDTRYSSVHQAGHSNATRYDHGPDVNRTRRNKWKPLRDAMGAAISDVASSDIMGCTLITWNDRGQQQLVSTRQPDGAVSRTYSEWGPDRKVVSVSSVTIAR